jgi:tetratricopeptide (TPR) repeat protein
VEPGLAALLAVVVLAYGNSFAGAYQFDDYSAIVGNGAVHSFPAWLHDLGSGIRPLLKLSYLLNWLSGAGRLGFHGVNLLVHLGCTLLLYRLARTSVGDRGGALLAAGIFALHPLQTEAVTYLCGRSASLAALFYLAALLAHGGGNDRGDGSRVGWLAPFCFVCALLVKETTVTLPAALLLWDISRGRTLREHLRRAWPCWLILAVAAIALALHPRYGALLHYSRAIRPWGENLLLQGQSIVYLISRLVVLGGMNIDPDPAAPPLPRAALICAVSALATLAAAGVASLRSRPWLGFGILWFLLHLLPTNSVIPRLDLVNDRQAYLPLAGVAILAGAALRELVHRRGARLGTGAAVLLLVVLALSTASRNRDYHSEIALWEDARRKSPRKARVHNNLGYAYFLAGRYAAARDEFLAALRLDPNHPLAKNNLLDNEAALIGRLHRMAGAALLPQSAESGRPASGRFRQ